MAVLRDRLPPSGLVLEIASGSGEHAAWYAEAFPGLTWQPTDRDPEALLSIDAWRVAAGLPNLLPPLVLDAATAWPELAAEAIIVINMIHIAPWSATVGLMQGAAATLAPGGMLFLYGPFSIDLVHTAPSNAAFDADLRARNPAWGVRDLDAVLDVARQAGFVLLERIEMPANNLAVILKRK